MAHLNGQFPAMQPFPVQTRESQPCSGWKAGRGASHRVRRIRMLTRYAVLKDLGISSALCLAERVAERLLFPGLHRTAGRMTAADPARADDIATLISEAIALFALVWLFIASLYAISRLTRRPLQPYATTLVM